MFKNAAGQKLVVFAFTTATNLPKTGDAANITAYVSIDGAAPVALTDTSASEIDASLAPGNYIFDLGTTETNGDTLLFTAVSSTSDVVIVPQTIYTNIDPNSTTGFITLINNCVRYLKSGTCTGGSTTTAVLDAGAASTNNSYVGCWITCPLNQVRLITAYNGGTRTATLDRALTGAGFINGSIYSIIPASWILGAIDVTNGVTLTSAYNPAKTAAQAGDAMALTSGERTTLTASIWNALTSGLTTVGSIGKWILDKLDVAVSSVAGGAGTGSRIVTLTVNDGHTVIQGASVRIYLNASDNQVATTNSSGVVTFASCGDGTYTVAISYPGYTFTPTTLSVAANTSHTYSMTALTVTPSSGDLTTGYSTVFRDGVATAGIAVVTRATRKSGAAAGQVVIGDDYSATSGAGGSIQWAGLVKGVEYEFRVGDHQTNRTKLTIPTTAGTTYQLPMFITNDP